MVALRVQSLLTHCGITCRFIAPWVAYSKGETCTYLVITVDPSVKSQIQVSNLACQPARVALRSQAVFVFSCAGLTGELIDGSIQQRTQAICADPTIEARSVIE